MRNITIRPNGFGMFSKEDIQKKGLPIFDFTIEYEAPRNLLLDSKNLIISKKRIYAYLRQGLCENF